MGKKLKLRKYQKKGVKWQRANSSCLLGDDTGLGKNAQTITTIKKEQWLPAFIVCPAAVTYTWFDEIPKWYKKTRIQIISKGSDRIDPRSDFIICSFGLANKISKKQFKIGCLVVDEPQKIKNPKAVSTKAVLRLAERTKRHLLQTSTPILNSPKEIIPSLQLMYKLRMFGGRVPFEYRYCKRRLDRVPGRYGRQFWNIDGASNIEELHNELVDRGIYLRRRKEDVAKDIGVLQRQVIKISISDPKAYFDLAESTLEDIHSSGTPTRFDWMIRKSALYRELGKQKINGVIEWAETFLENSDEALFILAHHKKVINGLCLGLSEYYPLKIVGATSQKKRNTIVKEFQLPENRLLIGNIDASGTGLDGLQYGCSNLAFAEMPFVPGKIDQGEGRLARIGQKKPVTCWLLVGPDTAVDKSVQEILKRKSKVIDTLTGDSK